MSTATLPVILKRIHYDASPPPGFRDVDALLRHARQKRPTTTRQEVKSWLETQDTYTLHKPNGVMVSGFDDQCHADLVDVRALSRYNRGIKFLLTCIGIFSKYA
ncbi:hypothetical protein HOLleu_38400 [Holothuria leucospilota]|uniref:Uncharacterized protein n=1 Tax=Holothuria leucospilota TaxID=206669 RepID=A0A9Q0YIM0_HOLLE|nr:hypothetical protein HOLleu_38400 [Holothuria leucospilota]